MAQNRSGLGNLIIVLLLGVVFFQVFADDSTTTCVTALNCPDGTFADSNSRRC